MSSEQPELSEDQIEFLNSLFDFSREGRTEALISVIDQGIPVDLADHKGDTFLILASYREQLELVKELISRGADLNITNMRGQTALTCAVFLQNEDLVRTLLEAGADPNVGEQSARATVKALEIPAMETILDEYDAGTGTE